MNKPMVNIYSIRAGMLGAVAAACLSLPNTAAAQVPLLPNLRAFPASNLSVVTSFITENPELRFSVTSWNSGVGPLELQAGAVGSNGQDVYQRVYDSTGGYQDYLAGTFTYDGAHQHFHFDDYALYSLQPMSGSGAGTSSKRTFCIMDTTKVNSQLPGAPRKAVYTTCNPVAQGMSVGWGDTYGANLSGQSIDLTGFTNGLYELTITVDPLNLLQETSDNDNTACSLLQISVTNHTVQDVGPCGTTTGNPVTITSISPNQGGVGTSFQVEILGSNFTTGIAVGFENGSGPAPVASDVIVQNSGRITAVVTIKNGGKPGSSSYWTLRVGSAVLANAFQVLKQ
jgi:Lysyl oxidase